MSATLGRIRSNGWRPSVYGCSTRRKPSKECSNKYITDVSLGPFVFNFLANVLRTSNSITESTTPDSLEKELLSGSVFSDVSRIHPDDLDSLLAQLRSGVTGMEYKSAATKVTDVDTQANERQILEDRRRHDENALNRLKSLYLFGEDTISEKDYIIERQKIIDDMNRIDAKLAKFVEESADALKSDLAFLEQASYLVMVDQLLSNRAIDFEKYIRSIDPTIPRAFLHAVISKIDVVGGRVASIQFKNDLTIRFIYS